MTQEKSLHLTEKEIIQAVVDETDLVESLREHLSVCQICRNEKERLENQLIRLGQKAERLAPLSGERFKLPSEEVFLKTPRLWRWQWQSLLAAGVAAAIIITVVLLKAPFPTSLENSNTQWSNGFVEDEQLMAEVSSLVENSLPTIYFGLSGESIPGVSEEFINFVIPDSENVVRHNHKKEEVNYV
jgi:hypothetical protein